MSGAPLPDTVIPDRYTLDLRVDPRATTFSGRATLAIHIGTPTDHIWLHARSLQLAAASWQTERGAVHAATSREVDSQAGVSRIDFGRTVAAGALALSVTFEAPFGTTPEGLYKIGSGEQAYAISHMERAFVRTLFPSFDEPGFNAPFDLSVTIPASDSAFFNTGVVRMQPASPGWKRVTFATTTPLPARLVVLAVGPFARHAASAIPPEAPRKTPLRLRAFAAKGQEGQTAHVLAATAGMVRFLEGYYDYPYPFGKLDLLAAPGVSAGSSGYPGLVFFRDRPQMQGLPSTQKPDKDAFLFNARELSRQWTGNIVTEASGKDVWLNESLATWMQVKVAQALAPDMHAELDRVRDAHVAMDRDGLASARALAPQEGSIGDASLPVDGATCAKGAAILGMFERYWGEEVFRNAVQSFIRSHALKTATTRDFIDALDAAASGKASLAPAFESFVHNPGVPDIGVEARPFQDGITARVTQARYVPLGSKAQTATLWHVPLCFRYGTPEGAATACAMLDGATGSMALPGATADSWVMPNADAAGYYRFHLDVRGLARLKAAVPGLIASEQLAYADAVDAAFAKGSLSVDAFLSALEPLPHAASPDVATAPFVRLNWLLTGGLADGVDKERVRTWIIDAYVPRLNTLGILPSANDTSEDAVLRTKLIVELASYAVRDGRAQSYAVAQGDIAIKGVDGHPDFDAIDADILPVALRATVEVRGRPAVDALMRALPLEVGVSHRNALLTALGAARDGSDADRVRDMAVASLKAGEVRAVFLSEPVDLAARMQRWAWFTRRSDMVLARHELFANGLVPTVVARGNCTTAEQRELDAYFRPKLKDVEGLGRDLAGADESMATCNALRQALDQMSEADGSASGEAGHRQPLWRR